MFMSFGGGSLVHSVQSRAGALLVKLPRPGCMLLVCLVSVTGVQAAGPVNSSTIEDAKTFLRLYASFSAAQNPAIVDLYSDRATIRLRIGDQPSTNVYQGKLYKQGVSDFLPRKTLVLDASVFKDVVLERRAGRLLIRAKRYSLNRCYWDTGYRLGIEREGGQQYRIVEEIVTTRPKSTCSPEQLRTNAQVLSGSAMAVAGIVPMVATTTTVNAGMVPNVNPAMSRPLPGISQGPVPMRTQGPIQIMPGPPGDAGATGREAELAGMRRQADDVLRAAQQKQAQMQNAAAQVEASMKLAQQIADAKGVPLVIPGVTGVAGVPGATGAPGVPSVAGMSLTAAPSVVQSIPAQPDPMRVTPR